MAQAAAAAIDANVYLSCLFPVPPLLPRSSDGYDPPPSLLHPPWEMGRKRRRVFSSERRENTAHTEGGGRGGSCGVVTGQREEKHLAISLFPPKTGGGKGTADLGRDIPPTMKKSRCTEQSDETIILVRGFFLINYVILTTRAKDI